MRGKESGAPNQPASLELSAVSASSVALLTVLEYQPMRVLMSVLLIPAAATLINTSPGPGLGTGMSSRNCNFSKPPCPTSSTPRIVAGMVCRCGNVAGSEDVIVCR
jgi:hypothetical protein